MGKGTFYFSSTNNAKTTGYPYTQKRLIWTHTAYDTQKLTETEHKPKALLKKKNNKLDFFKIKTCILKDTMEKMKRQATGWVINYLPK